jgi:acyl carrier protein
VVKKAEELKPEVKEHFAEPQEFKEVEIVNNKTQSEQNMVNYQQLNEQYIMAANESLKALLTIQTQTAALHQQFLASQAQTIARYQQLVERQQNILLGMPLAPLTQPQMALPPVPQYVMPEPIAALPFATAPAPVPVAQPVATPNVNMSYQPMAPAAAAPQAKPAVERVNTPITVPTPAPAPAPLTNVVATPKTAPVAAEPANRAAPEASQGVMQVVMDVISEKTGYPTSMLDASMGLDSDLGIDSIKRVEILSALAERLPDSPELGAEKLNELPTLGDVASYLSGGTSAEKPASTMAPAPTAADDDNVTKTVIAVVSEKTGYPTSMLDLSMGLDSDLGIDSIKRVEILSALAERLPDGPELGAEKLNELPTLGDLASYLAGGMSKKKQ